MKNKRIFIICFFAKTTLLAEELTDKEVQIFSEYIGKSLEESLQPLQGCYDKDAIIQGFKNQKQNAQDAPEDLDLILNIQNKIFDEKSAKNLAAAENRLKELSKNPAIKTAVQGKVLYEQLQDGKGLDTVDAHSTPLLHFSAATLDGMDLVNTWKEDEPLRIPVKETIDGFAKGVQGMKEGERRKIYIHPDFAYKKIGTLPPNSLLILDVEVLRID